MSLGIGVISYMSYRAIELWGLGYFSILVMS